MTDLSSKASRLFQFLADLQAQKERPVRIISEYGSDSRWRTLGSLKKVTETTPLNVVFNPEFQAQQSDIQTESAVGGDDLVIRIERPAAPPILALPDNLQPHIEGAPDNPASRPRFSFNPGAGADQLHEEAEAWLAKWDKWAAATQALNVYQDFFDIQVKATQQADEFELVLAGGWLSWDLGPKETIDRPIFVSGVEIAMDKATGAIEIRHNGEPVRAELEALSAGKMDDGRYVEDLKSFLEDFDGDLLNAQSFNRLANFTVNGLSTDAHYEPALERVKSDGRAVLSWVPGLLLRPRRRVGLSTTFQKISQLIEEQGEIPPGLRPLVDPSYESASSPSGKPGAMFQVGEDLFSPLPLNEKQKRVLERVDSHPHTIVQGPPGTGKTHMAAALLSHLLAQGKRVLVTAQADRALYELRDKLPAEVRELAVSVIGSTSQEMSELRIAIDTIQRQASNFDERTAKQRISDLEAQLERLKKQRTSAVREWAGQLEKEQQPLLTAGYELPLPQAILEVEKHQDKYGWINELQLSQPTDRFPLDADEVKALLEFFADEELAGREPYADSAVLDPSSFASPAEFRIGLKQIEDANFASGAAYLATDSTYLAAWQGLDESEKAQVENAAGEVLSARHQLEDFPALWQDTVPSQSSRHELETLEATRQQLLEKLAFLSQHLSTLADVQRISVEGNFDAFVPQAKGLYEYLESGKTLRVRPDGSVKTSLFGDGVVKAAMPFFDAVRINGLPPTDLEAVSKYLSYVSVIWELQSIQPQWPFTDLDLSDPVGSAKRFQLDAAKLGDFLEVVRQVSEGLNELQQHGLDIDLASVSDLHSQLPILRDADKATRAVADAERAFTEISGQAKLSEHAGPAYPWITQLESAIKQRDAGAYEKALERGEEFHRVGLKWQRFDGLLGSVTRWSEELARLLRNEETRKVWGSRLPEMEQARQWLAAGREIQTLVSRERPDSQIELEQIDRDIHDVLSSLAAERAWAEAVGGARMDGAMRATMQAYVQAVRRLGKGTGKYADQTRRDVRRHLGAAREAVPVWIMPIYKVVEQFELKQNMFDVVIIDEASQAGIESVFLQYLAPKVVVIGDDRQVSPSGVGQDIGLLQKVARQYLYDFDMVDAWVDPKRSLFDDANMRYGGRIALDEHRRCVPEIIEFSNELSYRPNNIELKPVREPAGDRLAPFRITRTPNATQDAGKANHLEADVLVSKVLEALSDPAYDDKTIGVISLLSSSGQADYIQKRLLSAVPPHVWEEREIKVGNPADFQGAERDVIFLSMVAAVPREKRVQAVTQLRDEQRYNVAVSRAKDQVWLFHSIGIDDLPNQDDIRYKLLDYAYRVAEAPRESRIAELVPDEQRVEPFNSLFEQQVYNELVRRGFYVIPHFDAFGRAIDLVVQGYSDRLAIECDGDVWISEQHAIADQSRQRDLERLGWVFIRLYEADFYLDREGQIQRIVQRLEELGIAPGQMDEADANSSFNVEVVDSADGVAEYAVGSDSVYIDASSAEIDTQPDDPGIVEPVHPVRSGTAEQPEIYEEFDGATVSVYAAGAEQIDQGLLEIIQVEGPIPEEMLFQRYVKAGGDSRVRDHARDVLRAGVRRLIRRGTVVKTQTSGRVYRTPEQPDIRPRLKGRRSTDDITPEEWSAHIHAAMNTGVFDDEEDLLKATSQRVGFGRFTNKMHTKLAAVRKEFG